VQDRQKTCGAKACKDEWHRRKCEQWNRENTEYFQDIHLRRKLQSKKSQTRLRLKLPLETVQEVIGLQHAVIIGYLDQLLHRRFQELFRAQLAVITTKPRRLPQVTFSRGDRH
jgi:hypothetical protein